MNLDNDDKIFLLTAMLAVERGAYSGESLKSCYYRALELNDNLKLIVK